MSPVELGGLRLKNPVLVASGTFGYGRELAPYFDLSRLGGIMVKGVSTVPWAGNDGVRVAETAAGMLNAIGLQNPGLKHFLEIDLPWLRRFDTAVIVNVVGHGVDEYVKVARAVSSAPGVHGVELNVSCPNVEGGLDFGTDPAGLFELLRAVRPVCSVPLFVKLSPNVTDPVPLARAAEEAGADGLSMINTVLGMAIDTERRRPVLGRGAGGLSGPAVRPIAVRMVWEVAQSCRLPIIGMGGIESARDALEFMMAGASAVAVGTATFRNPCAPIEVIDGLEAYRKRHRLDRLSQIVGAAWREGTR